MFVIIAACSTTRQDRKGCPPLWLTCPTAAEVGRAAPCVWPVHGYIHWFPIHSSHRGSSPFSPCMFSVRLMALESLWCTASLFLCFHLTVSSVPKSWNCSPLFPFPSTISALLLPPLFPIRHPITPLGPPFGRVLRTLSHGWRHKTTSTLRCDMG